MISEKPFKFKITFVEEGITREVTYMTDREDYDLVRKVAADLFINSASFDYDGIRNFILRIEKLS